MTRARNLSIQHIQRIRRLRGLATITSATTANCAENATLAHSLTASESVTWSITGGADAARFELSGSTLRWASNGTKNYESPNDANTDNAYVVQVTATNGLGNTTAQTVTVTVTNVNEAPTDIALSASTVAEDAALGTVVGALTRTDPDAGATVTYSLTDDASGKFAISGTNLIVSGVLDYETATSHNVTVRATDQGALTYDEVFAITVTDVSETPPANPLPDDGDMEDDGSFTNPPIVTNVNGAVKISGKKASGTGAFVYSIGAPAANKKYTLLADPDWSLLSNLGKDAFIGFGFLSAANSGAYELAGVRGNGTTGLVAHTITGTNFTASTGRTLSDKGASANGTVGSNLLHQIQTSADGTTYTYRTGTGTDPGTAVWTDEIIDEPITPFSRFGVAADFTSGDTGSFSIAITLWTDVAAGASQLSNMVLYTGNGGTQGVTGMGFEPDVVMIHSRSASGPWRWVDRVRGVTKTLNWQDNTLEATEATSVTAFDADGFTLGADGDFNTNARTYLGLGLLEGSDTFQAIGYTGNGTSQAIAHTLGVTPAFIVVKRRDANAAWMAWTTDLGANKYLFFDGGNAPTTDAQVFAAVPSATVFNVGNGSTVNANGGTYIAYVFAPKAGLFAQGTYTGTGDTSGPTLNIGFKPKILLLKATSTSGNWTLVDTIRDASSPHTTYNFPLSSNGDQTSATGGITTSGTGFQLTDSVLGNVSGVTYTYMAFA
jgi:hypothetical protein